ncbi:alanyl-tRNA editing protein AlaXM [Sphaerobacter sp.]|uniref:alanyl-tRNA editing protein AlaXM n=1 Tax=Sphaerobacter sp. TaxID=2099654 RepID=UPI001D242A8C|nr:alanyl-tRNA editing protein AlaXM [Sphaerobacter sp.]MBX5444163.1 alanyl-tRNA editing protein [Sphaerobacter sp.]
MTALLYLDDSYLRTFDATVTAVVGETGVVLDRTAFYPGGGGQPHDLGMVTDGTHSWQVVRIAREDGQIVHVLEGDAPPPPGTTLRGEIDWERRYRLMRMHSALHVLCGVVFREYGALVTGGNMGPDKARMDFELEDLNPERVAHIERVANERIAAGLPISWRTLPREEAFQIPDLIRTKINLLPPNIQEVRVVEIEGLDLQADGGTHVRNTREIGGLKVIGTRSKGRINKRLEIALVDGAGNEERGE